MNHWVFKANPPKADGSGYDYSQKLRVGREENWKWVKVIEPMGIGDRVFFWASTPLRHFAGLGIITKIHPKGGVRVRYLTALFAHPLSIEDIKAHPALRDTRVFKSGSYGTAFLLTKTESGLIYDLVVARNPGAGICRSEIISSNIANDANPALFETSAKFSDGLLTFKEALEKLAKLGINPGSATNYLYNTKHLFAGNCYKRHMTIGPITAFLAWIKKHRSPQEYQNSLQALEAHLQSRESSGINHPRHRELLARLRGQRQSDTNWLGHQEDSGATQLDELLSRGATMDELGQVRGGVHEHIRHLREKWGIQCEEKDGQWRMVGTDKSADDDLPEGPPPGCEDPKQSKHTVTTYTRNPAVRAYVLTQARGRCEYCDQLGFLKSNGEHYLEAHHLLALCEDGPDTPDNVVALCATHHREAHYGRDRAKLETAVLAKRKNR